MSELSEKQAKFLAMLHDTTKTVNAVMQDLDVKAR